MSTGMTQLITLSDILFGEEWNVDRTIAFMALWVPTSFKVCIFFLKSRIYEAYSLFVGERKKMTSIRWRKKDK